MKRKVKNLFSNLLKVEFTLSGYKFLNTKHSRQNLLQSLSRCPRFPSNREKPQALKIQFVLELTTHLETLRLEQTLHRLRAQCMLYFIPRYIDNELSKPDTRAGNPRRLPNLAVRLIVTVK